MLRLVVVVVVLVHAGGYPEMKKKLEGGLGGRHSLQGMHCRC